MLGSGRGGNKEGRGGQRPVMPKKVAEVGGRRSEGWVRPEERVV